LRKAESAIFALHYQKFFLTHGVVAAHKQRREGGVATERAVRVVYGREHKQKSEK
jgi:hypothetical protein